MTDCMIYGRKKDGEEVLIGTSQLTAEMKARELAVQYFGGFTHDDGSNADFCFAAMEQLIQHMKDTGWELNFGKFISPIAHAQHISSAFGAAARIGSRKPL